MARTNTVSIQVTITDDVRSGFQKYVGGRRISDAEIAERLAHTLSAYLGDAVGIEQPVEIVAVE